MKYRRRPATRGTVLPGPRNSAERWPREDLAVTTVRAYHGDREAFFRWYGPHRVEALTSVDLITYRQYLSDERSLKPASVNRKLEALRRFCRWAHQHGKLRSNVAAEVKLARPQWDVQLWGRDPGGQSCA